MLLTLLGIGAYTTYKFLDAEDKKYRWEKLMADFDMDNEDHFEEFLSIMKTSHEDIIKFYDRDMSDFLYHCKKNLKTVPYFTEEDIKKFEQRVYRIRAEHFIERREKNFKAAYEHMKEYERKFANKPKTRQVYSIRHLYTHEELTKLQDTFFGQLVYMPEGARFYSKTDLYTQFVVNVPEGANIDMIFRTCMNYVQSSEPSYKETEAVRRAGLWHEVCGED